jgi:hypothetical protein
MNIKKCMSILSVVLVTVMFMVGATGCGSKPSLSDEQKETFKAVVDQYCKDQGMGMVAKKVREGEIKGNKAKIKCSMKLAEGGGPSVTWKFELELKDDAWVITKCDR